MPDGLADHDELRELLDAWKGFSLGFWMREGVSEPAFERLRRALLLCAESWRGEALVPRLGMNVLVDMFPAAEASADQYEAPTRQRLLDIAYELQDLVRGCVAIDPAELEIYERRDDDPV
jgi:hypothetical protein